jgi:hypothetical protein
MKALSATFAFTHFDNNNDYVMLDYVDVLDILMQYSIFLLFTLSNV